MNCWRLSNPDPAHLSFDRCHVFYCPSPWTGLNHREAFPPKIFFLISYLQLIFGWSWNTRIFKTITNWISMFHQVQLLIYFMLKYVMEILLSESSVITTYYFHWSTSTVAIFLASLGLTVLPVNIVVGNYISNMFEDR